MKKSLLLLCTLVLISCSVWAKPDSTDTGNPLRTFTVQPGGLLEVDVRPGAVRIEPWTENTVEVEAIGIDESHPERLIESQSGNTVTVRYNDRRHHTDHLEFSIRVPMQFNVNIRTSGGSIRVRDGLTGTVSATSGGGSIKLGNIVGKVDAETGGGSIDADGIDGETTLTTGGGVVDAKGMKKNVTVRTGGGSIVLTETGGTVNASTGGGSITVNNALAWVGLSTGGGSIHVHGAKFGVKAETGGGSIELDGIVGVADASTGGGELRCELTPGAVGSSTLSTGGGRVQLFLPENAKASIEATINCSESWGKHNNKYAIRSDFEEAGSASGNGEGKVHTNYLLNGGGQTIILETSCSDIEIRKLPGK
jgi:hypothetical protein